MDDNDYKYIDINILSEGLQSNTGMCDGHS